MRAAKIMVSSIPISKARLHLGELTNKVFKKENVYILNKSGLPVAAIINMDDFEKLSLLRIEELNSLGRDLGSEANRKNITEERLNKMMKETRTRVYEEIYGK